YRASTGLYQGRILMSYSVIRCVLSGSYRKDIEGLRRAYLELVACGCQILSPHRMDFVNPEGPFVKDTAECDLSEAEIENHHLLAISQADFVWLHNPEGYVGVSGAFEVGYAHAKNIPVFSQSPPGNTTLGAYVTAVPGVFDAILAVRG
ncbi:MAG TPA: hypothetical protein VFT59_01720, partial [Candidatus Saccharimonadales bacterium]|nr:hypothetical protein [Candidatus Saccharimonadales bacterium]